MYFFKQRDCIQFALTAKPAQRYMPADHKSLQYKIWVVVTSKPFDTFILVLIALNTGVLMSQVSFSPQTSCKPRKQRGRVGGIAAESIPPGNNKAC